MFRLCSRRSWCVRPRSVRVHSYARVQDRYYMRRHAESLSIGVVQSAKGSNDERQGRSLSCNAGVPACCVLPVSRVGLCNHLYLPMSKWYMMPAFWKFSMSQSCSPDLIDAVFVRPLLGCSQSISGANALVNGGKRSSRTRWLAMCGR